MKCFVTFRLKPGVTPEQYLEWFRRENVPTVRTMKTIQSYRVWRLTGTMEGEPSWEFLEEMEIEDRAAFEQEVEEFLTAMLDGWYARVADQLVVFAEEVAQD